MTRSDQRLLSLLLLGTGTMLEFGDFSVPALTCVIGAVAVAAHSLSDSSPEGHAPGWTWLAITAAMAATTALYAHKTGNQVFVLTAAGLAVAVLVVALAPGRWARLGAAGLALVSSLGALAATMSWGRAAIDVFNFQQVAAQALLTGHNPYTPLVASPEMVGPRVEAIMPLHLPYGPIVPILEAPFRFLGDVRVLHALAALVTVAAVLALARRAGTLRQSGALVMAFPLSIGIVFTGWVDVITMAGFAVWLVTFRTHPRIAVVALVLSLGAKPTTLIALVPIVFWSVRARRQVAIAVAATALIVAPFALLTGLGQFTYDVLGVQLAVFPRPEALTINSFLVSIHLGPLPWEVSAAIIGAAAILLVRIRPRSHGQLLTATAVLATVSFLLAKWAFFNYYYIPAVLLMLAVAGGELPVDVPEMIRPPAALVAATRWVGARAVPRRRRAPGVAA